MAERLASHTASCSRLLHQRLDGSTMFERRVLYLQLYRVVGSMIFKDMWLRLLEFRILYSKQPY